jgi:dolichol-phosphate mannosyltransferase
MNGLQPTARRRVHVVAPASNEQALIAGFVRAVAAAGQALAARDCDCALTVVDDGSTDSTASELDRLRRDGAQAIELRVVTLSRNFGHQAALQAGLEDAFARSSKGDLFVMLDSDLQHPPELIPAIVEALVAGAGHVQMVRRHTAGLGVFKRLSSRLFYWLLRRLGGIDLPAGASDYRGVSRPCLAAYLRLAESGRFHRGLFHWVGFPRVDIPYDAPPRAAGETKYSAGKMLRLALVGLTQFSSRPLIALNAAIAATSFLLCGGYLGWEAVRYFRGAPFVMGWRSIVFLIIFWSGVLALLQLGSSLYLARVFDEVKRRPSYIVRSRDGEEEE